MKNRNVRDILFWTLCFVFSLGIIFVPVFKKNYKSNIYNNYSTTQVESFEKRLFGATGWAAMNLSLKESANNNSTTIVQVNAGQAFTILGENGEYWEIVYTDSDNVFRHGYVQHAYCMINLPDVVPSIKYNITNAYSSIYRTRNDAGYIDIPNTTGEVFYGVNCSNGLCDKLNGTGKVYNSRIGRDEFIVPNLYSASKKIAKAQSLARHDGYSLMIYDSYRPVSTSEYVSSKLYNLFNNDNQVKEHILHSYGANTGTQYTWSMTYFIADIQRGSKISSHNVGSAIDTTLCEIKNVNGVETCDEIEMFTPMHQLSTDSIKYYSKDVEKIPANYSGGMLSDENARRLDGYMIDSRVGMTTLASEWWHFEDRPGRERLTTATGAQGCDFQTTNIVSTYGFPNSFVSANDISYPVGDVTADGSVNAADAELIYNTYELLNTCETCDDIKSQADYNQDGSVNLDDVYAILDRNNDLLTSDDYIIGDDYIFIGAGTFDFNLIEFNGSGDTGVTYTFNDVRDELLIKLNGNVIKTYYVVGYLYTGNDSIDLSKSYIFLKGGVSQLSELQHDLSCTNCAIISSTVTNKLYFSRSGDEGRAIASYDLVYYTSDYYFDDSLNIYHTTVEDLISGFQCDNCVVEVYNDSNKISSGNIPDGSRLVIKETSSGNDDIIASANINFLINIGGLELDKTSLNLNIGQNEYLTAIVSPSNATNKSVTWSSSDDSVATVGSNGYVTAVGAGEAIITVKSIENENIFATCTVTVNQNYTVKYKWGSGEHEYITQSYLEGDDVISGFDEPNLMYVQGKKLIGWTYNNQDYDLDGELLMPSHDIELVARWKRISDDITGYGVEYISSVNKVLTSDRFKIGVSSLISDLVSQLGDEYAVVVYKSDNSTVKNSGNIGTGDIVKLYVNDVVVDKYTVSIKGDLNGSGTVNSTDMISLRRYIKKVLNQEDVEACYLLAGDFTGNGNINATDIKGLRSYIKRDINFW